MAGFAVVFRKDNRPPSLETHERMRQSLRIFGPDCDNLVEVGRFTMIWAHDSGYTPQDKLEYQPVIAEDRTHLVFLGFLMHRNELAGKLGMPALIAVKTADSVLVMMAWQKWGEDCLNHLYGPFSMVVCNVERQTVFAARGPERGINIFYHNNDERIILATSTKPIFCDPNIAKEVDERRISDALVLNYEDRSRSYFKGIGILPSGHLMRANPAQMTVKRFYTLENAQDVRFNNDDDYVEAAQELLSNAVASAMRAIQTPAVSLSSGLDSTAVAITMLNLIDSGAVGHSRPLKAYTSVPAPYWDGRARAGREGDESGPVRALAQQYPGLDVEYVDSEHLPFDHGLDHIQSYADMPIRGVGNLHWGQEISQRCRHGGKRVCLSGSSGNATFSMGIGGIVFGAWFRQGRWLHLLREHHQWHEKNPRNRSGYVRSLVGKSLLPNFPDWLHDLYVRGRHGNEIEGFHSFSAINPDYAQDINIKQRMKQFSWDDRYRQSITRKDRMCRMVERGARDESGGMQEAFKVMNRVDNRDPMGDRKILEFCYAIPDDQFFKGGVDRRLIKRMMAGRLPPEIMNARRGDQSADWHGRMKQDIKRIDAELDRLSDDPVMSQRLDIPRMRKIVQNWSDETPASKAENPDLSIARYAIGRAIAVARFINRVEGKN